jgi:hypothetical protein
MTADDPLVPTERTFDIGFGRLAENLSDRECQGDGQDRNPAGKEQANGAVISRFVHQSPYVRSHPGVERQRP